MAAAATGNPTLHTLADGAQMRIMRASELITIPIWKGNRILDSAHVAAIARDVGAAVNTLDFAYRIIRIPETDSLGNPLVARYIIDGQHRHSVLSVAFHTAGVPIVDFDVIVLEKDVRDEMEAFAYFRKLNHTKAIDYRDNNLLCNKYIEELMKIFNTSRAHTMIRQGQTRRPFLSVEKLREVLMVHVALFSLDGDRIKLFATQAERENARELTVRETELALLGGKSVVGLEAAVEKRFVLALDPKLPWIGKILREINGIS